jgi:heme/copper-type cytochrome/quinol oxidase subunit 2
MKIRRIGWLLLAASGLAAVFIPLPASSTAPQARTFRVDAGQFAYSPSTIDVNPGDRVTIQLVSTDVVHGLYVDGYGVSVEADPGKDGILTFVADKAGSFRFRCNVSCGGLHPFMIGKLHVGANNRLLRSMGLSVLAVAGIFLLSPFLPRKEFERGMNRRAAK